MSQLKAADFPPPEPLICLKLTADPNCRLGGFNGRCQCEFPEQTLLVLLPNLHISLGLENKFNSLSNFLAHSIIRKSALSHIV